MSFIRPTALVAAIAIAASLVVTPPPPATAQTPATGFTDHEEIAAVHRPGVEALFDQGVVQGCGEDAYCPAPAVTREQMATFIGRALGLPEDPTPRFEDVLPTSTHGGYIGALSQAGITTGCTVGPDEDGEVPEGEYYCPRDTVTREQMASFITRAYQLRGYAAEDTPTFDDATAGTHAAGIQGVAGSGVTTGCTATEFCPRDDVTREQMASFIARAMGLLRDPTTGCPTTVGPVPANGVERYGSASDETWFPVNSAELVDGRLFAFSIGLQPSRLVADDLRTNGALSTGSVVRTVEILTGLAVEQTAERYTWATEAVGDRLYFGQQFRGSPAEHLYRIGRNSSTPQRLVSFPSGQDGVTELWDITSDADGRLYIGTSMSQTVYRYTPGSGTNGQLDTLRFGGPDTGGQVTQLEYDEQDDTLYIGTGRGTARLLAVDEVSAWQPQNGSTTNAVTARQLIPGGDPGLGGVSNLGQGVYSLDVTDDLIAVGMESSDARVVTLERIAEPVEEEPPVEDDEPIPGDDGDGTADEPQVGASAAEAPTVPEVPVNLDADPLGDVIVPQGDDGQPGSTAPTSADPVPRDGETDGQASTAAMAAEPATYAVRDSVRLTGESKVESVRVDAETGAVFAAGATTGQIYRVTNAGDEPSTTEVEEFVLPIEGAINRNMFIVGSGLVGVASTGDVWSVDRVTGSDFARNSPRDLVDAGASTGSQLPQSMAVGGGQVAVGANNAIFLHSIEDGDRRTTTAPGEPKTMTVVGDDLYAAMYPSGSLFRLPLRPVSGTADDAPGSVVATWGGDYGRPREVHHDAASDRMLVAARAPSAETTALIGYTVPDDPTGPWPGPAITHQPIAAEPGRPAEPVFRLTTAAGRVILGGAGAHGRVTSRPVNGGAQQWTSLPVTSGGPILALETTEGQRVHGLSSSGAWFELDRNDGQVRSSRQVLELDPEERGANMASHGGWLYAAHEDCLVAIDVRRQRVETLRTGLDSRVDLTNFPVAVDPDSASGRADVFVIEGEDLTRIRHLQR